MPGRPTDPEGVKALAVTAKKCWDNLRPGGMRVRHVSLDMSFAEAFEAAASR